MTIVIIILLLVVFVISFGCNLLDAICLMQFAFGCFGARGATCLVRQPPQSVIHRLKSGARGRLSTWKARHGNGIHGWFTY
jgi:hypothetical protein